LTIVRIFLDANGCIAITCQQVNEVFVVELKLAVDLSLNRLQTSMNCASIVNLGAVSSVSFARICILSIVSKICSTARGTIPIVSASVASKPVPMV
jgi:hypothetical protein